MANWGKKLFGLAAIGGAAAGLVYYLKSKEDIDTDEFDDEFDNDDFDLDNDLKASTERGYVPLTPKKSETEETCECTDNEESCECSKDEACACTDDACEEESCDCGCGCGCADTPEETVAEEANE